MNSSYFCTQELKHYIPYLYRKGIFSLALLKVCCYDIVLGKVSCFYWELIGYHWQQDVGSHLRAYTGILIMWNAYSYLKRAQDSPFSVGRSHGLLC